MPSGFLSGEQYLTDISVGVWIRYLSVSAAIVVVWDWVTSLADEVAFIWLWKSGLSGRPLYCFLRYGGMAFAIFDAISQCGEWNERFCRFYYPFMSVGTLLFLYAADLLLAYRALCLWRMKRWLVIPTTITFCTSAIGSFIILSLALPQFEYLPTPAYLGGCWIRRSSLMYWVAPFPSLLFEFWVFGLVVSRAIKYSRSGVQVTRLGVARLLIRDSMWWFTAITSLIITNAIWLGFGPPGGKVALLPITRSIITIFGCRLILHMRKATSTFESPPEIYYEEASNDIPDNIASVPRQKPDILYSVSTAAGSSPVPKQIGRTLSLAQRIGLPPPLAKDLFSMWYDPISTLNQNVFTTAMEMDCVSPATEESPPLPDTAIGMLVRLGNDERTTLGDSESMCSERESV